MKKISYFLLTALFFSVQSLASQVNIDLSGATSSTLINAGGASFSQTFTGQTVSGTGITGSPTNPLSLTPSGMLAVAYWSPGCSGCADGKSILSQPGNQAPLAILLDSNADSFSWVMGYSSPPSSVAVDLFSSNGSLVHSMVIAMLSGYNKYSFSGLGTFAGIGFRNNNDSAGVRFMDMSYNSVSAVPLPTAAILFAPVLLGLFGLRRKATSAV